MNTITFDTEKAKQVETAVCSEFGNSVSEIVGFGDTVFKKVVVFVLHKHLGYDKRMIGHKYQMTYLFVPTVVDEVGRMIKMVSGFESKINAVLKRIENEKTLEHTRNRSIETALS